MTTHSKKKQTLKTGGGEPLNRFRCSSFSSTCYLFMIMFHFILGTQHSKNWKYHKFKKSQTFKKSDRNSKK